jgi:hypothetical protein
LIPAIRDGVRTAELRTLPIDDVLSEVRGDLSIYVSFRDPGRLTDVIEYRDANAYSARRLTGILVSRLRQHLSVWDGRASGVTLTAVTAYPLTSKSNPSPLFWPVVCGLVAALALVEGIQRRQWRRAFIFCALGLLTACAALIVLPARHRVAADIALPTKSPSRPWLNPGSLTDFQIASMLQTPYGYLPGWERIPSDQNLVRDVRAHLKIDPDPNFANIYHVEFSDTSDARAASCIQGVIRTLDATFWQFDPNATSREILHPPPLRALLTAQRH